MRLATCWAYVREFEINKYLHEIDDNEDDIELVAESLPTKEEVIKRFDNKQCTASQWLAGLKQTINDFSLFIQYSIERKDPQAIEFLAQYKTKTGRNFFSDAGNPKMIALKIIKRGKIANDTEFYMLKEILSDLDQTILSKDQSAQAENMLGRFEFGDTQ